MEGEAIIVNNNNSNNNNNAPPPENLPSAGKFKGVVPQHNGHWGAQIYTKHQRIWLGTFKTELDAAMAYDSAAINIRTGDSFRNLPRTTATVQEPAFQSRHTPQAVLAMIKDGSYQSKFSDFLRSHLSDAPTNDQAPATDRRLTCKLLFQKELTPSDVGKLNRLVIPKKYAVKYLPPISCADQNVDNDDVELVFVDRSMRKWKFRYCYWSSSQSYVFTRGWNRFVKEKDLKANETVAFLLCERKEGHGPDHKFCMIFVDRDNDNNNVGAVEEALDLRLATSGPSAAKIGVADEKMMNLELELALRPCEEVIESDEEEGVTLFGVHMKRQCLKKVLCT